MSENIQIQQSQLPTKSAIFGKAKDCYSYYCSQLKKVAVAAKTTLSEHSLLQAVLTVSLSVVLITTLSSFVIPFLPALSNALFYLGTVAFAVCLYTLLQKMLEGEAAKQKAPNASL